jgi:pimeloyl-ACP methyl ester carboxylesterase
VNDLRYATVAGHHLAYRERSGAPGREKVLFTPGGTIPMDFLERDRVGARLLDGFAALGRLVLFDRRGIGLSDPISDWSRPLVEQWADDLAAIVETASTRAPVVVTYEPTAGVGCRSVASKARIAPTLRAPGRRARG